MRSLVLVATVVALAWARPETYKETEDFKYSRSSSDEGSKSGSYAAQRGNTVGNYERAHNMDSLAQHQMSGAINQVQGELGDALKNPAGSVYTAANSRGVYGSSHYDLSNLQGRNFQESASADSSHSSISSAYNQQAENSDWRRQSQRAGYGASSQLAQSSLQAGRLHAAEATGGYGASNLQSNSQSSGYHSASGYHAQSGYNSLSNYDQTRLSGQSSGVYGAQAGDQAHRYTIVTPVRIVGRPGSEIAIPVYAQAHGASSLHDQSLSNRQIYASQRAASSFDENAINSEAEVLNNNQQHISSVPVSDGKHYSSSWNYHKAWERHSETTDTPVNVVPTANPLSMHSELYEDTQGVSASNHLQQAHSQNSYAANAYNSAYSQSGASQSNHQSDYRLQQRSQSDANSNAYHAQGTLGSHAGLAPLVDSQPKSYQSSYAYHKSWERQGDPYVIVPTTNGEASQRLTSSNTKTSASAQRYGSQQHYAQAGAVDCDSRCRYRRSTRSYSTNDYSQQTQEDLGQQAQTGWEVNNSQLTEQHYQPARLEDLGQQTQSWGNLQQQGENLGQQTQHLWVNTEQQQQQSQKPEDLGQQTQPSWNNFQQSRPQKLEHLGQQTQQSWDTLQQQHQQPQKLEDLGQQAQGKWQESGSNLEEHGQQTQQSWDNIEQQSNRRNLEDLGQQTQGHWDTDNQQLQSNLENLDNFGQQTQSNWGNLEHLGQQTQQTWNNVGNRPLQNEPQQTEDLAQQTHSNWDDLDNLGQQVQTEWGNINRINNTRHTVTKNTEQQIQTHFGSVNEVIPNKEHASNTNIDNPDHPGFWTLTHEQKDENKHYSNQHHSYNIHNSYSNSQSHGTSWRPQVSNNNTQSTHSNPLQSLWDKIDNMEEQSEHSSNASQEHTEYQNSQNTQESKYHHESNWQESDSHHEIHRNHHETQLPGYQPPIEFNKTIDKPKKDELYPEATSEKPKDDNLSEESEPAEIGRGDIGAEEESATTPKTLTGSQIYTTHIKPEKTPEEIEALSLSRGTEEHEDSLSVLSISQQKWLEEQRKRTENQLHEERGSRSTMTSLLTSQMLNENTTPATQILNIQTNNHHTNETRLASDREFININPQYQNQEPKNEAKHLDQPDDIQQHDKNLDNFGQQSQDLDQQNLQHFTNFGQNSQNFDQQNTGQQLEDFGQQTQDLYQQNLQQFGHSEQHSQNFDQQNTEQQLENLGQQSQDQNLQQFTNMGQHSQNIDQTNTGQQVEDFGQQSQDLQQFVNLGQHSQNIDQKNTGQQLEDFGQQNQDLNQDLQQFSNLEQHSQNFDQQNTGDQWEDFGQQTQDLNQQNPQQTLNLEQNTANLNQHQAREFVPDPNTQTIQERNITPKIYHSSQTHLKQEVEIVPPSVITTEKPGFWKSVGNKLTNAKDSVVSWFKKT